MNHQTTDSENLERAELIAKLNSIAAQQERCPYPIFRSVEVMRQAAALLADDAKPIDMVLAALDELKDDAAVHIYPDDLEKCSRSECAVTVYSVRCGRMTGEKTVPLFSREQVAEALKFATTEQIMSLEEYNRSAMTRLAAIDALAKKIDFNSFAWRNTSDGERYERLMQQQSEDEVRAGL